MDREAYLDLEQFMSSEVSEGVLGLLPLFACVAAPFVRAADAAYDVAVEVYEWFEEEKRSIFDKLRERGEVTFNRLAAFLVKSAKYYALNAARKEARHRARTEYRDDSDLPDGGSAADRADDLPLEAAFGRTWKILDETEQKILKKRYELEKSFDEIASDLSMNVNTVRGKHSAALAKLHDELENQNG